MKKGNNKTEPYHFLIDSFLQIATHPLFQLREMRMSPLNASLQPKLAVSAAKLLRTCIVFSTKLYRISTSRDSNFKSSFILILIKGKWKASGLLFLVFFPFQEGMEEMFSILPKYIIRRFNHFFIEGAR